jgi:hypothetical protein
MNDELFDAYCFVLERFSLQGREEELEDMTDDEIIKLYLNRDTKDG